MKFCPTCQTRYDEEILRFCTKDGVPLIEENTPSFDELPSADAVAVGDDDFSEETVISRNAPKKDVGEQTQPLSTAPPRIVIQTDEPKVVGAPPPVRAPTTTVYQSAPRAKSNTGKIVALTLLGTFLVLGSAALLYLMTREPRTAENTNQNVNTNVESTNTNPNANLNVGGAFNSNGAGNSANGNANANANLKTPTPKPSPSAPSLSNVNNNLGAVTPTPTPKPSVSPTPSATPSPTAIPTATPTIPPPPTPPGNRAVNAGVLNGRAVNLPKPAYPPIAKQMRAAGQVAVQVVVDESGNIMTARATSGNVLLRASAAAAARQSKINPITIDNRAVKATGILLYNFINQ